ncbi:MAG: four helix bundle protein [Candidatus Desulfofervidus sp.]|nr:four helix bundle protein [Candidatus Desulfofervidus sp.]
MKTIFIDTSKITSAGDFGKNYGLCDQLRRAADSIASNTCPVK